MESKNQPRLNRGQIAKLIICTLTLFIGVAGFSQVFIKPTSAATGINRTINFQGKVVNKTAETNVTNGNYSFTFKFYDAASGGTQLPSGAAWSETKTLTVTNGIFRTALGDTTAIPASLDFNSDNIYLDMTFNGETFTTRIRMTSVPYAFNAEKVAGLTVTNTTGTLTIPNAKTISFADAFTTSGAFPLTLTQTASTNVTLPTTGTLVARDSTDTLTNKSIGSTLTFSGVATDITTGTNEHLALMPNGTGNVGIGTTTPGAKLEISGGSLIIPATTTSTIQGLIVKEGSNNIVNYQGLDLGGVSFAFFGTNRTYGTGGWSASGWHASRTAGSLQVNDDVLNFYQFPAGSNTPTEVFRVSSGGNVGIGSPAPASHLEIDGNISASAWGLEGIAFDVDAASFTDSSTATSGTATNAAINSFGQSTIAATNATVTTTNAYGMYIAGAPISGTNQTITNTYGLRIGAAATVDGAGGTPTNSYGLYVDAQTGATSNYAAIFQGGNVGIGLTNPGAKLDVAGGNINIAATTSSAGQITQAGSSVIHTYGNSNFFAGTSAGNFTTTGTGFNIGIGPVALFGLTSGSVNVAIGSNAMQNTTTGAGNVAVGYAALFGNTEGSGNTALGLFAGRYLADGTTANETPGNSVYIGYDTRASAAGLTNENVFGYSAIGNGSNSVTLGNSSVTKTVLRGDVGIGTTGPSTKLHVVGGARITGLVSCNTIDTDADGVLSCGTDATGAGGATAWSDITDPAAALTLNHGTNLTTFNFANTTTTGFLNTFNSITSGTGLSLTSTATAFTGNLADITLSGSNAANTGSLLSLTNSGTSNTNTSLYLKHYATGTNNLALRVDDESGDATPFVIDGSGNVGIGITNPNNQFTVNGYTGIYVTSDFASTVNNPGSQASSGPIINARGFGIATDSDTLSAGYQPTAGIGIAINRAAPALTLKNSGGPALLIEAGSVGIGTSNPGAKLDVLATSSYNTNTIRIQTDTPDYNNTSGVGFYNNAAAANPFTTALPLIDAFGTDRTATTGDLINSRYMGGITLGRPLGGGGLSLVSTQGLGLQGAWQSGSSLAAVFVNGFKASSGSGVAIGDSEALFDVLNNQSVKFRMLGNGNVGIGTTAPNTYKLHVVGNTGLFGTNMDSNASTSSLDINGAFITIGDSATAQTLTNGVGIKFFDAGVAHSSIKYLASSDRMDFCGSSAGATLTCGGTPTLSLLTLNNSTGGKVGIGDTTPDALLDIESATAPTVDLAAINGSVAGTTTTGVDGLQIDFTQADDADGSETNSGLTINMTSSSGDADTLYGINIANITAGSATEYGLRIGTGWDRGLDVNSHAQIGSTLTATGTTIIGSGGNTFTFNPASGPVYAGTARPSKTMILSPEYPGAAISADGSSTTDGSMISDNELNATAAKEWKNYYQWTSTNGTTQDYSVIVRITLPQDFDSWETGSCPGSTCGLELAYATGLNATTNNAVSMLVNNATDTPGTAVCTVSDSASATNDVWTSFGCTEATLNDGSSSEWDAAGKTAVLRIKLKANSTASALAKIGDITLRYKAKF